MQVQPIMQIPPKSDLHKHTDNFQLDPVYTLKSIGPASSEYIQPDGFTQFQVLEMRIPIAHFMGCMARLNAQNFLRNKQLEISKN